MNKVPISGQRKKQQQNLPTMNNMNLNSMLQQLSQTDNLNNGDIDGVLDDVLDKFSGLMGPQMDSDAKNKLKQMSKSIFTSMVGDPQAHVNSGPSQIEIPTNSSVEVSGADFKVPKVEKNYEELDDDEEVDVFRPRTKDIVISLGVSLEEVYMGKQKKLAVKRKRIVKDPQTKKEKIVEERKKIVVPIEPGMRDEQLIRYNKQADEIPGYDTGDIVINLRENGHNTFEREGDNLFIVKKISLFESFAAASGLINLTIRTLDNRILRLDAGGIPLHLNDGLRKINGEGMPKYRKEERGDLYIRFNLILPEKIEDLNMLKTFFPPVNDEIIYNDGSRGSFDINGRNIKMILLQEVTEKDLEELDYYMEEDDSESESESRSRSRSRSNSESRSESESERSSSRSEDKKNRRERQKGR